MDEKETCYEKWCNFFTENQIPIITNDNEGNIDKMIVTGARCQGTCYTCFRLGARYEIDKCLLHPLPERDIIGYTFTFSPAGRLKRIKPNKAINIGTTRETVNLGFSQKCGPTLDNVIAVFTDPTWKKVKGAYELFIDCEWRYPDHIPGGKMTAAMHVNLTPKRQVDTYNA